ncbi:serine/threonine protein kinase [Shewanella electrodiphila]|uniref:non-specific serine/threonine protein kinase n=1 Tax=Shewanella electrodiphila TaxID=934143 RepID=A0ABT0KTC5_9GAMM|nr:serine/threonine-protein kinase [Shewanella electrodiphila]MCL1046859.1 serine/threonine protein kinase [Shewanella electrodiphila]
MIDIVTLYTELSSLSSAEQQLQLSKLKNIDSAIADELERMLQVDDIPLSSSELISQQVTSPAHTPWQSFIAQEVMGFRIKRLLSDTGGMGLVFHAEQTISNSDQTENEIHKAAVKILRRDKLNSHQQTAMFFSEASSLMALDHPNICSIYGVSEVLDHACIVMDYIDGESLDLWLANSKCNQKQKIDVFMQLLEAVCYLHYRDIYHGDLKPQNIIINNQGNLVLIDLGLAKKFKTTAKADNRETIKAFSKNWSAPEQIAGEHCEAMSDVYSLGAILFYLLTSDQLEQRDLHKISDKELHAVLSKALSVKPENRYQDALQFRRVLQQYQTGFPIDEYSMTPVYQLKKLIFRKPFTCLACFLTLYSIISSVLLFANL